MAVTNRIVVSIFSTSIFEEDRRRQLNSCDQTDMQDTSSNIVRHFVVIDNDMQIAAVWN